MRRVVGIIFFCIAAILYMANYLAAMMYIISRPKHEVGLRSIRTAYRIVGKTPENLAYIALFVGIVYLVIGELEQIRSKKDL